MVFDVTLVYGSSYSLEYDSKGGIIMAGEDMTNSYQIQDSKVGQFTILKDPVKEHINLYALELFDLPLDQINLFKAGVVKFIIIRIGSGSINGLKNFDLHRIFFRPITILEQSLQKDLVQNDIIVKGISLTANAMLLDSAFGAELEEVRNYTDAQTIQVGSSATFVDYTTSATNRPINAPVSVTNYNPGNIISTGINWAGEVNDGNYSKFEKFATPELGFRALALNVKSKIKNGKGTLGEIIAIWAPPSENDTSAYQQFVSKYTGLNLNDPVKETDIANLAKAISWYEGDNKAGYYTNDMINNGMAMAGINSKVSSNVDIKAANPTSYEYGDGSTQVNGTNINRSINIFNNSKGTDLLNMIVNRMKEKYGIEVATDAMAGMLKSNFLYKNISLPASTTIEILKKIHKDYPAYHMEIPWILDDVRSSNDQNKIGKSWYTELGILNINSLPVKNLFDSYKPGTALFTYFNAEASRPYYKETLSRIEAQTYVFKDLTTGVETVFQASSTMELASIPDTNSINKTSVGVNKIKINTHKVVNIEASFSAEEFKKRLEIFKTHVQSNPQLIKCHIRSDDPNLIEFGYAYTFDALKYNKITPYKIKMVFKNVENKFQLEYEVDFYKGISIES